MNDTELPHNVKHPEAVAVVIWLDINKLNLHYVKHSGCMHMIYMLEMSRLFIWHSYKFRCIYTL